MTPGERVARANKARELLEDDLMKSVFSGVRNALIERLEACPMGDMDTQHEIALTLQLLKQLQSQLRQFIQDGTLATKEIEQETWLARARKKFA